MAFWFMHLTVLPIASRAELAEQTTPYAYNTTVAWGAQLRYAVMEGFPDELSPPREVRVETPDRYDKPITC